MLHPAEVDLLCNLLRLHDVTVDLHAQLALRHVTLHAAIEGESDDATLKAIVAAVVVKSAESARFDEAWARFLVQRQARPRLRPDPAGPGADTPVGPDDTRDGQTPSRPPGRWRVSILLGLVVLVVAVAYLLWPPPDGPVAPPPEPPIVEQPKQPDPSRFSCDDLPSAPVATFPSPSVDIQPGEPVRPPWWPHLALGLAGLVLAGWALRRGAPAVVEPAPPLACAPVEAPPLPRLPAVEGLLTRSERDRLVWGIGRFVSEEASRTLDVRESVRRTIEARGLPTLSFERERAQREVWLWVDRRATSRVPELAALAAEIVETLRRAGLPVERRDFNDTPSALTAEGRRTVTPAELEAQRHAARVAVLTDGGGALTRQQRAGGRLPWSGEAPWRRLSHWPALAVFVPEAEAAGRPAAALFTALGCAVRAPENLASWLAEESRAAPASPPPAGDVALWAAACALCPTPVDEAAALALARHLGVRVPWLGARTLRPFSTGRQAGRVEIAVRHRRALGSLLARTQPDAFERAAAWWRAQHDAEQAQPAVDDERMGRRAERALLDLYSTDVATVEAGVQALWALRDALTGQAPLMPTVSERLREAVDAEFPPRQDEDCLRLPWSMSALRPERQIQLARLGFGAGRYPEGRARRTSRIQLAAGLGLGVSVAAAVLLGLRPAPTRPTGEPVVVDLDPRPAGATLQVQRSGLTPLRRVRLADGTTRFETGPPDESWRLTVGVAGSLAETHVASAGDRVSIRWNANEPCARPTASGALAWRCGTRQPAPTAALGVVRLEVSPDAPGATCLALRLLDVGAASAVYLGREDHLPMPFGPAALDIHTTPAETIVPGIRVGLGMDLRAAAEALVTDGEPTRLETLWPGTTVRGSATPLMLPGPSSTPPTSTGCGTPGERRVFEATKLEVPMRCAPAGRFLMGSPVDVGDSNEHPQQPVSVQALYVGETEVTQAQWTALGFENRSDFRDSPTNPVEYVNWFDAIRFCNALSKREGLAPAYRLSGQKDEPTVTRIEGASGYRLPTEAEWEYAARAGTTTRWSFGDDEARLGEHAWYRENAGGKTHPVARKKPNPWGLYDVHGNVWEWCEDGTSDDEALRSYSAQAATDPRSPPSGPWRVVRGGSWSNVADMTRSAVRLRWPPVDRSRYQGFRLVRPPPSSTLDP